MNDTLILAAAMDDEGYRSAHAVAPGRIIPAAIVCPDCGKRAPFKNDALAARFECELGHAAAAMHADPCVAGTRALRPWPVARL